MEIVGPLYEAFVTGIAPDARPRFDDEQRVARALAAHWQAAREAWPAIALAPARFASELARRLGTEAGPDQLDRVRGADVYLAIACADGDGAAIEQFERTYMREIEHAAQKTTATRDQIAEVTAVLRRVLFVDEPGRPAATREFSGRGDLRSYVRVMATRDLIRAVNRSRREVQVDDDELIDRIAPHRDPELSFLRDRYRDVVDAAMRAALAQLDERTRALLRYQLIDGWNVDQVGRLYGVHRATAARWIAAARETLGEMIRGELATRLNIERAEVDSIVRLVQSRVDLSLDRMLGEP